MLFTALAVALILSPQEARDPQVINGVIRRAEWVQMATAEQMAPPPVDRADYNPSGVVELVCTVIEDGRLNACRITTLPTDYPELGGAAFEAANHMRHALLLEDGTSAVGMKVGVKLRWVARKA